MVRALFAVAGTLATAGGVSAATPPVPLMPPTGYRDLCAGIKQVACPVGGVPMSFWRPLALPESPGNGSCPASTANKVFQSEKGVLGTGPVYLNVGNSGSVMLVPDPPVSTLPSAGSGWHVGPLKMALRPSFRGPLLVRGARIDTTGDLGFSRPSATRPRAALQFPPRSKPRPGQDVVLAVGGVWLTEPGCYGIQFDGASFSYSVVFRVEFTSSNR
jgi:hypothetical protein